MTTATSLESERLHPLTLAASTWFACGVVLLGLAPLPGHTIDWGWSSAFWLLAAPLLALLAQRLLARGPARVASHANTRGRHPLRAPMARRRSTRTAPTTATTRNGRAATRRSRGALTRGA